MKLLQIIFKKMLKTLLILIKLYQYFISPLIGKTCRFYPSCSVYAEQAIKIHNINGIKLIIKRLCKCHPYCAGGYDPVPSPSQKKINNK